MKLKKIFKSEIHHERYYLNYFGNKDVRLRLSDNRIQHKVEEKWVDAKNQPDLLHKRVHLDDETFYIAPTLKYYYYVLMGKWDKIKEGWRVNLCELIGKDPFPEETKILNNKK